MRWVDRVRVWQDGVERRVGGIRPLSFGEYSFLLFVGLMVVGFVLTFLCFVSRVHPLSQGDLSSPVFYFGLAGCMLMCYIYFVKVSN